MLWLYDVGPCAWGRVVIVVPWKTHYVLPSGAEGDVIDRSLLVPGDLLYQATETPNYFTRVENMRTWLKMHNTDPLTRKEWFEAQYDDLDAVWNALPKIFKRLRKSHPRAPLVYTWPAHLEKVKRKHLNALQLWWMQHAKVLIIPNTVKIIGRRVCYQWQRLRVVYFQDKCHLDLFGSEAFAKSSVRFVKMPLFCHTMGDFIFASSAIRHFVVP